MGASSTAARRDSLMASVRSAAAWSMAAQYCVFAIQFAVSVLVSRLYLDPAEVGLFSVALAAAMMIAVLQDFGTTRYVSGQPDVTPARVRAASSIAIGVAAGIALAIAAAAPAIASFYNDDRLIPLLHIVAAAIAAVPIGSVSAALLARDMDYRGIFAVNVLSALGGGATALILAAQGFSAAALAWAMLVQALLKAIIAQSLRPVRPALRPSRADAAPILRFGLASLALGINGAIGTKSQDLIVGRMFPLSAVGLFSRAAALAGQLSSLVTGAINAVFYPAFARLRDEGAAFAPPYLRVVAANTAINWAASAGLAAAAVPLVVLLFGERWIGVAPLLHWIALAELCFVALPLNMDIPILLGRIRTLIVYNTCDTLAAIGLLIAASLISLEAAAIARLAWGLVWFAIYARFMQRLIGFAWRDMLTTYAKSAMTTAAAVAPMLLAYRFWRSPATLGLDGLALCTLLGIGCWMAALMLVRHPAVADIAAMANGVADRLRRRPRLG